MQSRKRAPCCIAACRDVSLQPSAPQERAVLPPCSLAACLLPWPQSQTSQVLPQGKISWTKHFSHASSLWEWLLEPLLCWTVPCSIPRQWGQGSAQLKGNTPGLSPCSFQCCKISPSCLLYFELMTVCPLSTSTLFPRGNWSVILFSSAEQGPGL